MKTYDWIQRGLERIERRVQLQLGKGWEPDLGTEVDLVLSALPQPSSVIDCGANVGDWSAELLKRCQPSRLLLVEPDPDNAAKLRQRFPDLPVVEAALSSEEGTATLFADKPGSGLASLHNRDLSHVGLSMTAGSKVATTTLPKVLTEHQISQVALLKIDVEGHELSVLRGAMPVLASIEAIQFEFGGTDIDSRCFFRDFWNLLAADFQFYRLSPRGLMLIHSYREQDESFCFSNYLCLRRH